MESDEFDKIIKTHKTKFTVGEQMASKIIDDDE